MSCIRSHEITPKHLYTSRRQFIAGAGALAASVAILGGCATPSSPPSTVGAGANSGPTPDAQLPALSAQTDELDAPLTTLEAISNYNDYYEFSTGKEAVAGLAQDFPTRPWTIDIGGLVHQPTTMGIEDLLALPLEERVYRMRCVEGWSMVIPWIGFPLSRLLDLVEPMGDAAFVRFETIYDPEDMPGQTSLGSFPWPYTEGLRIDEAYHDLTILSVGLYGELLLPQNGAPVRLVVPWKYGFKSIKAIVKIDLVAEMPTSLWMATGPDEYGFWANVNPAVPHPRWSQATERRIGEAQRRETLLFNGYTEEVADLYPNLDDQEWFY